MRMVYDDIVVTRWDYERVEGTRAEKPFSRKSYRDNSRADYYFFLDRERFDMAYFQSKPEQCGLCTFDCKDGECAYSIDNQPSQEGQTMSGSMYMESGVCDALHKIAMELELTGVEIMHVKAVKKQNYAGWQAITELTERIDKVRGLVLELLKDPAQDDDEELTEEDNLNEREWGNGEGMQAYVREDDYQKFCIGMKITAYTDNADNPDGYRLINLASDEILVNDGVTLTIEKHY